MDTAEAHLAVTWYCPGCGGEMAQSLLERSDGTLEMGRLIACGCGCEHELDTRHLEAQLQRLVDYRAKSDA